MASESKNPRESSKEKSRNHGIPPKVKKPSKIKTYSFFSQLNPTNWFNALTEISISMEEFGATKK